MQKYQNSLIRQFPSLVTGNAAAGVQVTVYVSGTNTLASLYATDSISGPALSNPVATATNGFYSFYAPDGKYRLVFSDTRYAPLEVQCLDAVQVVSEIGMGQGLVGQAASAALQSIASDRADVDDAASSALPAIVDDASAVDVAASSALTNIAADVLSVQTATDEAIAVEIPAQIARLGLEYPPIPYATGLTLDSNTKTYSYLDVLYMWGGALGTTTTGAFDEAGWQPIQGDIQLRNDVTKGTSLIRDVKHVASVAAIGALSGSYEDQTIYLDSFHLGEAKGAGHCKFTSVDPSLPVGIAFPCPNGWWVRQLDGFVTPEMFGARGDGIADDTASIQNAINYVSQNGGGKILCSSLSSYGVSNIGTSAPPNRQLALELKAGVLLDLNGSTIARIGGDIQFDIIRGTGAGVFPDVQQTMGVVNGTIDGGVESGDSSILSRGFNVWLSKVKNVKVNNIISKNPASWGIRLQECIGGSFVNNIKCEHGAIINADGVHLVDCRDMAGSNFEITSKGDDGFIIEAQKHDVFNLSFTNIVTKTAMEVPAAGRGVLVFRETLGGTVLNPVEIKNINLQAICVDASGATNSGWGFQLADLFNCKVLNSTFDITASNCQGSAVIASGATSEIKNNTFIIKSYSCTGSPQSNADISVRLDGGGVIDNNTIHAKVFGSNVGRGGVSIGGNNWQGTVSADSQQGAQVPGASGRGISVVGSNNNLTVSVADYATSLAIISNNSTFNLGRLSGAGNNSIRLESGGNIFVGGSIDGTVSGANSSTRFIGTEGANNARFEQLTEAWNDSTAGRIPTIRGLGGIFGVGAASLVAVTDINDITLRSLVYKTDGETIGTFPLGYTGFNANGALLVMPLDSNGIIQVWVSLGTTIMFFRRYVSGWGAWRQVTSVAV